MSKKLNTLLEGEISRFNSIIAYQDKMMLDEVSYKFYNEAEEPTPEEPVDGTEAEVTDMPAEEPAIDGTEGNMDDMPAEEPDMGGEGGNMDDMPAEEPDMGGEEVTEVDVTDLVNSTNDIKTKLDGVTAGLDKINDIVNKVNAIETNLVKMDSVLGQLNSLTKQVELMRPPTEEERRKALAQDSYPFNVSIDDYNKGVGVKNQTELEDTSKMSMFDTLMKDYNELDVKKSFNYPNENPFLKA
jgi:hypothetical protein